MKSSGKKKIRENYSHPRLVKEENMMKRKGFISVKPKYDRWGNPINMSTARRLFEKFKIIIFIIIAFAITYILDKKFGIYIIFPG